MLAVTDASPMHYLILIGQVELLPRLYEHVILPHAVVGELLHLSTPPEVRAWIGALPPWCEIRQPHQAIPRELCRLGAGEREAIVLVEALRADIFLVDDDAGRKAARPQSGQAARPAPHGDLRHPRHSRRAGLDRFSCGGSAAPGHHVSYAAPSGSAGHAGTLCRTETPEHIASRYYRQASRLLPITAQHIAAKRVGLVAASARRYRVTNGMVSRTYADTGRGQREGQGRSEGNARGFG